MMRVDVSQLERSARRLYRAADSALDGLARAAAVHLAETAAARTPVDTGKLRAAWRAGEVGTRSAFAENPVQYASFVEFDTRHWISRNIVPGQRFMRDAMAETEEALPEMVEARLRDVIGRCFGV